MTKIFLSDYSIEVSIEYSITKIKAFDDLPPLLVFFRWIPNSAHPSQTSSGTWRRFSHVLKLMRWSKSVSHSLGTMTRKPYPKVTAHHCQSFQLYSP